MKKKINIFLLVFALIFTFVPKVNILANQEIEFAWVGDQSVIYSPNASVRSVVTNNGDQVVQSIGDYYYLHGHHNISDIEFNDLTRKPARKVENVEQPTYDTTNHYVHQLKMNSNTFVELVNPVRIIKNGTVEYSLRYKHTGQYVDKSVEYTGLSSDLLQNDYQVKIGEVEPHTLALNGNTSDEKQFSVTVSTGLTLESAQFEVDGQTIQQKQNIPVALSGKDGIIKIVAYKEANGQRFNAQVPFTYNRKLPEAQVQINNDLLTTTITKNENLLTGKTLKYETEIDGAVIEIASVAVNQLGQSINLKDKFNTFFETRSKSDVAKVYPIRLVTELDGVKTEVGNQNYTYTSKLNIASEVKTTTNKPLIDSDNKAIIILKGIPKYNRIDLKLDGKLVDLTDASIIKEYSATEANFSPNKDENAFTQNMRITIPLSYIKNNIYSDKALKPLTVNADIVDKGNVVYNLNLSPISVDFREVTTEEVLKNGVDAHSSNYSLHLLRNDTDTLNFEIKASEEIEKVEYIMINGIQLDSSKFNQNTVDKTSEVSVTLNNMNVADENSISFGYKVILKSGKVKEVAEKAVFNNASNLVLFVDRVLDYKNPIIKQTRENHEYQVTLNKQSETIYSKSNQKIKIESSLSKGYMGIPALIKEGLPLDGTLYLDPVSSSANMNQYLVDKFHTNWGYDYLLDVNASGNYAVEYRFIKLSESFPFKVQIDDIAPIVTLDESNLINKQGNRYYVDRLNSNQVVNLKIDENFELDVQLSSITVNGNPITGFAKGTAIDLNIGEDKEYLVEVIAYDKAGNKTEKQYIIVKDTKAPNGKLVYQKEKAQFEDKAYFSTKEVEFKFEENEPFNTEILKEVQYSVTNDRNEVIKNGTLAYPGELTVKLENVADGLYTVSAKFIDLANNSQSISSQFIVDTTLPELIKVEDVKINGTGRTAYAKAQDTLQFNFTTNERAKVIFEIEGNSYEKISENNVVTFEHILIQDEVNSVIEYKVTLVDTATNIKTFNHKTVTIKDVKKPEVSLEVKKQGQENNVFVREGDTLNVKLHQNENVESDKDSDRVIVEILNHGSIITTLHLDKANQYQAQYVVENLTDEKIEFRTTLMDYAGNVTTTENSQITFDKTNPTGSIVIANERSNQIYNHDVTLTLTVNELNTATKVATYEIYHENQMIRNGHFPNTNINDIVVESVSAEGKYRVIVKAIDAAQNTFEISKEFEIDKTKPNIRGFYNGSDIVNGKYYNVVATPEFRLDENKDRIISVTLNGNNVTNQVGASTAETNYKYVVVAMDDAQNQSEYTIEYNVDITSPRLIINYLLTGTFYKEKPTPTVDYSDVNLLNETFVATLDGNPYVFGTPISNGNHTLIAQVRDKADNTTTVELNFGVSENGLSIVIPNAINQKFLTGKVNINLFDFIQSSIDYDIINATINGESFNNEFEITKDGKYVIYFEVKDKAGNIQKKTIEFVLDNTKPNIIFDNVKEKEKFEDERKVKVYLENNQDEITKVLLNGEEVNNLERVSKSEVLVEIKESKEYKLEVFTRDSAGNESSAVIEFVKVNGFCWICLIIAVIVISGIGYIIFKKKKEVE